MIAVTVCADRCVRFALGGYKPVDPFGIFFFNLPVATPAGPWNIEVVDRRLRVQRRHDFAAGPAIGMAVDAGCRQTCTAGRDAIVHAGLVDLNRPDHRNMILPDDIRIFMTPAASVGKIQWIDGGGLVVGREDVVFPVAVKAPRHQVSRHFPAGSVPLVRLGRAGMTISADHFRQIRGMRQVCDAGVTIPAIERAMHGTVENFRIDIEREHPSAGSLRGKATIPVALEALRRSPGGDPERAGGKTRGGPLRRRSSSGRCRSRLSTLFKGDCRKSQSNEVRTRYLLAWSYATAS
jgi:hypothetical protein